MLESDSVFLKKVLSRRGLSNHAGGLSADLSFCIVQFRTAIFDNEIAIA
jgi:hypothetical protein